MAKATVGYHGGGSRTLRGEVWVALDRAYAEAHGRRHCDDDYIMHQIPLDGLRILDLTDLSPDMLIREELADLLAAAGVGEGTRNEVMDDWDGDSLWWILGGAGRTYLQEGVRAAGYDAIKIRESCTDTRVGPPGEEYETILILDYRGTEAIRGERP